MNIKKDLDKTFRLLLSLSFVALLMSFPDVVFAQDDVFLEGAQAIRLTLMDWLTPVAIILVMALGAMAMANRISWGWCFAAILGIAIAFGAETIVEWVKVLFGVEA